MVVDGYFMVEVMVTNSYDYGGSDDRGYIVVVMAIMKVEIMKNICIVYY